MNTEVSVRVREFLARFVRRELDEQEDIFASAVVNSLFAMQLVMFVEQQFGFTVEDEDLELDNFRSIAAITRFRC